MMFGLTSECCNEVKFRSKMARSNLTAYCLHLAILLSLSEDFVSGISSISSSPKICLKRLYYDKSKTPMRLVGGSTKSTADVEINYKLCDVRFSAFDSSCPHDLKRTDSWHALKTKQTEGSDDFLRSPKYVETKASNVEEIPSLFQTPLKHHSAEIVGITPRARQRELEAQISPSKIDVASPVTESETVSSPKTNFQPNDLQLASRLRGFQASPMKVKPDSAIFRTPMLKNAKTLRRIALCEPQPTSPSKRNSSTNTLSQPASEVLQDSANANCRDDLLHVSLKQKLQLESITMNGSTLSSQTIMREPECKPVKRISLSSRQSVSHASQNDLLESNSVFYAVPVKEFEEYRSAESISPFTKADTRHNISDTPLDQDDLLKRKEDDVLASLQSNAESLHAALLEFEDDCLQDSYDVHTEQIDESGDRPLCLSDPKADLAAIPSSHEMSSLPSLASNAYTCRSIPHHDVKQVSITASIPAREFAVTARMSRAFVIASIVLLSTPSAAVVSWLGMSGVIPGNLGWISGLIVIGVNVSAAALALALYTYCAT